MGWIKKAKCDGPGCGVEGDHRFEARFVRRPDSARLEIEILTMEGDVARRESFTDGLECFCGLPCLLRRIGEQLDGPEAAQVKE